MGFPLADGYHVLPRGKLAAVVTWLEMCAAPEAGEPLPEDVVLIGETDPDVMQYRQLFRAIGEKWLWFARLEKSVEELGVCRR